MEKCPECNETLEQNISKERWECPKCIYTRKFTDREAGRIYFDLHEDEIMKRR